MGKYDDAIYNYLSDNSRFADLFNGVLFGGEQVIRPEELAPDSERYTVTGRNGKGEPESRSRFRDIKKRLGKGAWFAVACIENQKAVDYSMPWRVMDYDRLEYEKQLRELGAVREGEKEGTEGKPGRKKEKRKGRRLSREDKLCPVYTICFYHGEEPWDGPRSLKEMMDFGREGERWEELFHDYGMTLYCANEEGGGEKFRTGLGRLVEVLRLRSRGEELEELWREERFQHLDYQTWETIAVMTNNTEILGREEEYRNEKEEYRMCKALEDMKRRWTDEGKVQGIQQGIQVVVKTCLDLGVGFTETMIRLRESFSLSEEEAGRSMELYWK